MLLALIFVMTGSMKLFSPADMLEAQTPILIGPDPVMMLVPLGVGVLAAFVGYARLRLAPLRAR